ncbi:sulfatase [Tamlana fucoidanivorans]|uniref:Sulfatase n=1 Tax=Allotamlana fucoidanivorans TaxID=2583814 RepID=A0A5C4SPE9_9FLAO|nr:sulfatase [Tamlana fucoidanivorans]TNJ46010.1 sulfatase [Tamlana fucoidanivorans]
MYYIYKQIITFFSILALFGCKSKKERSEINNTLKKPNIVLINVDDLGWKDLGFMGSSYYETPNLDKLAQEGMVFTNAYAGAANCAPSRACLISGLNTPRHGVYTVSPSDRGHKKTRKLIPIKNTKHLHDSIYTLPQMLKSGGYITSNFGKWHVGNNPAKQGIDYNVGGSGKGNPGKNGYFSPYNIDFIEDGPEGEYLTDRLTNEAVSFIEKHKDTTFFVYMPFYSVHTPIMGKDSLVEKFKTKKGHEGQNNAEYAAMVASMDENVGKLLNTLKTKGLEENTLVIFTSDNGGIRAISHQDPLRAGKGSYYEGGIRVPLIIKWPNHTKPNTTSLQVVSNLDFYPTLQTIAAPVKKAKVLDGVDLNSLINTNQNITERDLFFHFPVYLQAYKKGKDSSRDPLFRTRPGSVIISGDWKLHQYFEDGAVELYNLKTDLGEAENIAASHPDKVNELLNKLEQWRSDTNAPIPTEINPDYDLKFEQKQSIIKK